MGVFVCFFKEKNACIPEDKREEFKRNVEKVFVAGGMMEKMRVSLYGKTVETIRKASMHERGMNFYYNYFEDDNWENAGFSNEECRVWSNKVGTGQYCAVVVAAYVLQEIYTDGVTLVEVGGDIEEEGAIYTGWLNYVLNERMPVKNNDPWRLYEWLHERAKTDEFMEDMIERCNWICLPQNAVGVKGYFEIYAVEYGSERLLERFKLRDNSERPENDDIQLNQLLVKVKDTIHRVHEQNDKKEQADHLLAMLKKYYSQDSLNVHIGEEYADDDDQVILFCTGISDMPAFVCKVISEEFDLDFWEIWEDLKPLAKRRLLNEEPEYIPDPIPTEEALQVRPEDMIPYWEKDGEIRLSDEVWEHLLNYKDKYDKYMSENIEERISVKWIIGLMTYANEEYYRIFTFNNFLEETMDNIRDKRFCVLWKIYEDMLHDPEMIKAGSVIYATEDDIKHGRCIYDPYHPDRRMIKSTLWCCPEDKFNPARRRLREYMAFVANKELRKEVLGI